MADSDKTAAILKALSVAAGDVAITQKAKAHSAAMWGVAAGLEIAARVALDENALTVDPVEAAALLDTFRAVHYAHLIKKETASFRRRPPNLRVTRVVKGKKNQS